MSSSSSSDDDDDVIVDGHVPILIHHGIYRLRSVKGHVMLVGLDTKKKPSPSVHYMFQSLENDRVVNVHLRDLPKEVVGMEMGVAAAHSIEESLRLPEFVKYLNMMTFVKAKLHVVPSVVDKMSLYRAISNACTTTDTFLTPEVVGHDVRTHIQAHKTYYGHMIYGDVDAYAQWSGSSSSTGSLMWPGKPELMALSELYHLSIQVYYVNTKTIAHFPTRHLPTWPTIRLVCLASESVPPIYQLIKVVDDSTPIVVQRHAFTDDLLPSRVIAKPYDTMDVTSLTCELWSTYFRLWMIDQCHVITDTTWDVLWDAFNITPATLDADRFPLLHAVWDICQCDKSVVTDHQLRTLMGVMIRAMYDLMRMPLAKEAPLSPLAPPLSSELYMSADAGMGLTPDTRLVAWMIVPVYVESGGAAESAKGLDREQVQNALTSEETMSDRKPFGRFLQYLYRSFRSCSPLDDGTNDIHHPDYRCPLRMPMTTNDEFMFVVKTWQKVDFGETLNERGRPKTYAAKAHKGHFFLPEKWYTMDSLWCNQPEEFHGPKIAGGVPSDGRLYSTPYVGHLPRPLKPVSPSLFVMSTVSTSKMSAEAQRLLASNARFVSQNPKRKQHPSSSSSSSSSSSTPSVTPIMLPPPPRVSLSAKTTPVAPPPRDSSSTKPTPPVHKPTPVAPKSTTPAPAPPTHEWGMYDVA